MKNGRFSRGFLVVAAVLGVLGGCSDSSISTSSVDTDTYLFYSPWDGATTELYGLKAVDPAYPSSPIKIMSIAGDYPSPFKPVTFLAGDVDTNSKTISDLHYRYVMYTDGTNLFRVDAEKTGGLGMAQVSNETEIVGSTTGPVPGICYTESDGTTFSWALTDYADPLNSVFLYRKDPDGTTDCSTTPGNDTLNAVQLSDDSSTAPNSVAVTGASEPVAPVYNTDGSINSILMWSGISNTLTRYSVDLGLQATLASGLTASVKPLVLGIDGAGNILLAIRNGSGTHIYRYDPATQTLGASPLYSDAGNTIRPFFAADGTYAYFHDAQKIYRVPFDGSTSASVVIDESANFGGTGVIRAGWNVCVFSCSFTNVQDMRLSGNNLVYIYDDSPGVGGSTQIYVRSVTKSGGAATSILDAPAGSELLAWRTAYGRVYLSTADTQKAISVGDRGETPTTYDNSWWMGFTFESTARLFSDFSLDSRYRGNDLTPKSIFRVQYDEVTGDLPGSLISYDANTTSQLVDFGVPATTFGVYNIGGPPDTLGLTTSDRTLIAYNGMGGGNDILYLHARNKTTMTVAERDSADFNVLVGVNNGGGCSMGNGRFDPLLPAMILFASAYLLRRRVRAWIKR